MTAEHLLKGWDEFEPGATLFSFEDKGVKENRHVNNSIHHSVADWRVEKPVHNPEHCIDCQFCWVYCPDTSIIPDIDAKGKGIFGHIDYKHCKGCGICVDVCPTNPKSLLMFLDHLPTEECVREWPEKEEKKGK
ncbi:MAG: 4Fe-4S binding protein [Campylobacterales bacterium]|nr:4Fe-4S binding protein [Campylobacterales bacterium]